MDILQALNVQCTVWHGNVCLCETVSERVGEKRGSAWQVCVCHDEGLRDFLPQLSKWPSVFSEPLSQSLSDLDNEPLFVMFCLPGLASSRTFSIYTHASPKWVIKGTDVMCDSSSRQSATQLWWPLSLTSSWAQFISLSARLIWSMSRHCWHNSSSIAEQYVTTCPSLPLLTTDTRTLPSDLKVHLYICTAIRLVNFLSVWTVKM